MCQTLCWHANQDIVCSLHNTSCKGGSLHIKKLRSSEVNYLQMINTMLEKRNYWNCSAMPCIGVQQRTWPWGWPWGFQGFNITLSMQIPKQQGGPAGACWEPSRRFVAWTAMAGRVLAVVSFHDLKINHSFINKEILLLRIKSKMTKYKRDRTKVIFLFA